MTLAEEVSRHTHPGDLFVSLDGNRIRCVACGHRCPIAPGFAGVCKLRSNDAGVLRVPYGYVNILRCDPIEKKPFFHAIPGATTLSFGMLGCSLHCDYCQNWVSSQALRDLRSDLSLYVIAPDQIVAAAVARDADAVVSTYNEPLITAEWAIGVFRSARAAGLVTGVVSNGYATAEVLRYLRPALDLFKVDLKCMNDRAYRRLGGRLQPVLDSIQTIHEMGFWLEVVTLVVPGFNDSDAELGALARFLAGVSPEIPWHVSAFHPDYHMAAVAPTSAESIERAARIGRESGLRYVYAGNLGDRAGDMENTRCIACGALVIERRGFRILRNCLSGNGACPSCGHPIPGFWRAPERRRST